MDKMKKLFFVDIGELGWSFYLTAHIRWLQAHGNFDILVMTYPDRHCLYNMADSVCDLPADFYLEFPIRIQNCFGLSKQRFKLMEYFKSIMPENYSLPKEFEFRCKTFFKDEVIYRAYPYQKEMKEGKEILIFPRYREESPFRNLPKDFYVDLIRNICQEFPGHTIRTMGISEGAYVIDEISNKNYVNDVKEGASLQEVIDRCQIAIGAVGGTSSLPKLTLLQGIPTFIIGHEHKRFTERENWGDSKVAFFEIAKYSYNSFRYGDPCANAIIRFLKEACE